MDHYKWEVIIPFISIFIIVAMPILSNAQNNSVTIEANIVLISLNDTTNESIVSINVIPDYLYFGNVVVGTISNVANVSITNTGTIKPAKITVELVNSSDNIFNNLQLKESSGSWKDIVNFTANVSSTKRIDLKLNLMNFEHELDDDIVGHKNVIKFLAMAA